MLFHLGVSVEEDSACEDDMECLSLKECRLGLTSGNRMSNILFKCNHEQKKYCCPSDQQSLQVKMKLLPNEKCGKTSVTKITNGKSADFGQYPWMALLGARLSNGSLIFICGGTLISDRYVLTAAHCIRQINASLEKVRLGEHNLDTDMDCNEYCTDPVEDHQIEKSIPHQLFDAHKLKNDIALVRLKKKVPIFTDFIKPICLPFDLKVTDKEGKKYEIAGWGKTDFYDSKGSSVLQFANQVYTTPLEECNPLQAEHVQPLTDTQLCAGGTLGEDACKGDSGGPLMSVEQHPNRRSKQYFQFGIVSFGAIPCGAHTTPSVYTRVSKYLDWILDHIEE
ncbi:hypothetical protein L9F63_012688 [Diploptera punctata]|uniref:Peptidase S1 domain-containing protein n=1 Tax=Diploptera punctata TaxID=6984 RepID=A0AAD8ABU3_DIPPU|nr:hypothetical protein L9F63_012688 [Diploptera punctata]